MELCAGGPITKVSLESTAEPIPEEKARHIFGQLVMGKCSRLKSEGRAHI